MRQIRNISKQSGEKDTDLKSERAEGGFCMEEKKKKSTFGILCKVVLAVAAAYAAVYAAGKLVAKKTKELEEKNDGQKKKRYLSAMNGKIIKIGKEPVEEIDIHTYLGGVTLDLTGADFSKEMEVNINSLMSGVIIKVPPMVRVVLDGSNMLSGFANMVPQYETEELPVVFIYAESLMSGIAVQMVPDVKKDE